MSVVALLMVCGMLWAQQEQQPAPEPKPDSANVSDLVVARVSGDPITEKQVLSTIDLLAGQTILTPEQSKQRNTYLFQGALENLITASLLKEEAKKRNISVDKTKVDQQVQRVSSQYPSQQAFQKALEKQGGSEAELRKIIEESLMMQQLLNEAVKDVLPPSEADVVKFYNDNPDKFPVPEKVHAAHILLKVGKDTPAEQKEEIRKKLEDVRAKIESKEITFADAAAKYSQDPASSQKGGDLGFFARGQMVPAFDQAAFSLNPGSLSPVIETQFGYHIIQVIEREAARKATLDESRTAIEEHLDRVNKQQVAKKFVDGLKANARIETFMTAEEFGKRHPVH